MWSIFPSSLLMSVYVVFVRDLWGRASAACPPVVEPSPTNRPPDVVSLINCSVSGVTDSLLVCVSLRRFLLLVKAIISFLHDTP